MPTFIDEADTSYTTTTTPKTSASFDVIAGDLIVISGHKDDSGSNLVTPTNSGTAFTWTLQQTAGVSAAENELYVWTAIASVTQSMTVTGTISTAGVVWGFNRMTIRNHGGVGTSVDTTSLGTGAPTLNITTTRPGSLVVVFVSDNAGVDGSSRTWRTNAGALSETLYSQQSTFRAIYLGYHADAGPIGTYAVGLTAPTGQSYNVIALEILAPHTKRPEGGMVSLSGGLSV